MTAGLEKVENLLKNVNGKKDVVLLTTGMCNATYGKYSYSGKYDNSVIGNTWYRIDTNVKTYAYANAVHIVADRIKEHSTIHTIGVFQTMENATNASVKEIASFHRIFTKDLASSSYEFYSTENIDDLVSSFSNIANEIQNPSFAYSFDVKNVTVPSTPKEGKANRNKEQWTGDVFEFTAVTSQNVNEISICGDKPDDTLWHEIPYSYLKENYGLDYVDNYDGTRTWTCWFGIHETGYRAFMLKINGHETDYFTYATLYENTDSSVKIEKSGTCGDNLTWTLDSNGTLKISGSGEMDHFGDFASVKTPWYTERGIIKNVIVDNGVTSIGQAAFCDCDKLTSITIPSSVTSISWYAFCGCSSLTSISIPDSVTSIGDYAFWGCSSLKSISIPKGVTSIEDFAFNSCSSLTSIGIPKSVTDIKWAAFTGCGSLTDVYYEGTEAQWANISIASTNEEALANAKIHFSSGGSMPIGATVGYALTTDIKATINGYDIPSFNVNGYTYIVVEDLRYYGFDVTYDDSRRMLSVERNNSMQWVSKSYTKPYVSPSQVGQREHNLLYTDIKTFLNGGYTESYNINGQTIIRFDALAQYGNVAYDNNIREISLKIDGLNSRY